MAGNTLGEVYRITNWGESHGPSIGVVVDGCPSDLAITPEEIQVDLDRRKPGQSKVSTSRNEKDTVQILSGVFEGKTTGTPISLLIQNKDYENEDYENFVEIFRPGHADFTYKKKYGRRDPFGGGRSSARITAGHVAAGAIAKKYLTKVNDIEIVGYVKSVKDISINIEIDELEKDKVESNIVRCPDQDKAQEMISLIEKYKEEGDSVGGVVECVIKNPPIGLGEPVFSKLHADLAHAALSINATKGFEIGEGFKAAQYKGSEHNDSFDFDKNGEVITKTNHAGGVLGGISNGMPIKFRVAFKPPPTIGKEQDTINEKGDKVKLSASGRHDPCVVPRAVPIVEAMAANIIMDHYLRQKTRQK